MFQVPLVTSSTILPVEKFWSSLKVYHDRPHLINRKLLTVKQLLLSKISLNNIEKVNEIFTREALLYGIRKLNNTDLSLQFLEELIQHHDKNAIITESTWETFHASFEGIFVSVRILYGRKNDSKCFEFVIFNKKKNTATFLAIQENNQSFLTPNFPYHIELHSGNLRIIVDSIEDADTASGEWLADKLFPKLVKWAECAYDKDIVKSLSLVPADEYCLLYHELKKKHGSTLVKVWPQKANTDPSKFVFEDLAIAAYLITFWRKINAVDVNFVDCGCGNGLLVYILNQEGYRGCGLDLRSRKLWDLFQDSAELRVETVTPSSLFPEATWIIGNHSDELTPWIPVLALKSSPKTNFFVIPCCFYDFSGRKYERIQSNLTQYADYVNYVQSISEKCGFETHIDKLRIPSTKRICLTGFRSNYPKDEYKAIIANVETFINSRLNFKFTARNSIEVSRNCTRLSQELIKRILSFITSKLLENANYKNNFKNESWNKGGTLSLSDLSRIIPLGDRKSLKKECGGLQTLLKNHRYIFDVRSGAVSFREPPTLSETAKYKDKPCWFYRNHPNGCLFDDKTCAYNHDELK